MLDDTYLWYGINALSRAHQTNYFLDGHRGGAIISSVYFCRENQVDNGVAAQIAAIIDQQWAHTPLCAPFPEEPADPALRLQIVDYMSQNLAGLREAGHNVILPTLALKALHQIPEAITPPRVSGICQMIPAFTITEVPSDEAVDLPDLRDSAAFAEFVLNEFLHCLERFSGRGQGWSGHLLTYSKALLDLSALGYEDLADQAKAGYKAYIRRIRLGPQQIDQPRPEREQTDLLPLMPAYWRSRVGDLRFGHQLKYPYGFYGLLAHIQDSALRDKCLQAAYRIL